MMVYVEQRRLKLQQLRDDYDARPKSIMVVFYRKKCDGTNYLLKNARDAFSTYTCVILE